jgi:hypothetical protein
MFNILNYQGHADQNYIEISAHPNQNGYYSRKQITTYAGEDVGGGKESLYIVGGN